MTYGAHQYRRSSGSAFGPRETEATAFTFVNRLLSVEGDWDARMRGLGKNQQLWSMLLKDVACASNGLPSVLKADLTTLGFWVMRQSISAIGNVSLPVSSLVQVNEDMIAALRAGSATGVSTAGGAMALTK